MIRKFLDLINQSVNESAQAHVSQINLNANENSMSETASKFLASRYEAFYELSDLTENIVRGPVTMKGDLMYRNLKSLKDLILAGQASLKKSLNAIDVDLRPLSGVHAMQCTILALSEPGDEIWSLPPQSAGHFATSHIVNRSGRRADFLPWNTELLDIDFAALEQMLTSRAPPALIFLDQSLCLYPLSIKELRRRCPNSIIVYDGSHTLGLILGKQWPNPFDEGADIFQGNTHKTFPGPQKALIATRNQSLALKLRNNLNQGLLSSQHTHHTAALATTALEFDLFGQIYAKKIIYHTRMFARILEMEGFEILARRQSPPQGHMILAKPSKGIDPYRVCTDLMKLGIACNARVFNGETWLRFGTQNFTRRGGTGYDILCLALLISDVARGLTCERQFETVQRIAGNLAKIHFSLDSFQNIERKSYEKTPALPRFDSFVS
jgi:glycine hydroxymethyltransferase